MLPETVKTIEISFKNFLLQQVHFLFMHLNGGSLPENRLRVMSYLLRVTG